MTRRRRVPVLIAITPVNGRVGVAVDACLPALAAAERAAPRGHCRERKRGDERERNGPAFLHEIVGAIEFIREELIRDGIQGSNEVRRWFGRARARLTILERHELTWLLVGLGACVLLLVFVALAGKVMEGDTLAFDTKILRAFRQTADPSTPIGPRWIEPALLDLTALGGPTVLGLLVVSVAGFLTLQRRYGTALFIFVTSSTGVLVGSAMKALFMRPRPTIVPQLRPVAETSFPSGHAMQSAIVFLTLGALLMRIAVGRLTKLYCFVMAMLLTFLVGVSRVYLGVHYPTDVLGGWIVGMLWASTCWLAAQYLDVGRQKRS